MKAKEVTFYLPVISAQDRLQCNSRCYCSFLKENTDALGNCVQHYCIKKGKSSLVGDRELTFLVSSLKFEASGTFLCKETSGLPPHHWLCCCSTATSVPAWECPGQPPLPIKCPGAVTRQQQDTDDQGLPHCSWKQTDPTYSSSPFHIHWGYLYLCRVFPSSWPLGTPDQPHTQPWPSLTAARAGAKAPLCGDLQWSALLFISVCRGFWKELNSALHLFLLKSCKD